MSRAASIPRTRDLGNGDLSRSQPEHDELISLSVEPPVTGPTLVLENVQLEMQETFGPGPEPLKSSIVKLANKISPVHTPIETKAIIRQTTLTV